MIKPDCGSASGLSMTKVIELMKINSKMIPSNILAVKFLFLLAADFLVIGLDVLKVFCDRVFLCVFDSYSVGANEMI